MDLTDVREKFTKKKESYRSWTTYRNAQQAISMANFNQQCSQKCNIKILGCREQTKENFKENLCAILKRKVNINVNPADILVMHRVPGNRSGGTLPVLVSMISTVNLWKRNSYYWTEHKTAYRNSTNTLGTVRLVFQQQGICTWQEQPSSHIWRYKQKTSTVILHVNSTTVVHSSQMHRDRI